MNCFSEDETTSFRCKDMGAKGGKMMNLLDAGPSKKVTVYTLASEPFRGRVHQLGPSSQLQILQLWRGFTTTCHPSSARIRIDFTKGGLGGWIGSTAPEDGIRQNACYASSLTNHKGIAESDPAYSPKKLSKQGPGMSTVSPTTTGLLEWKNLPDHAPAPVTPSTLPLQRAERRRSGVVAYDWP